MNKKQVSEITRKFLRLYCKIFNEYTNSLYLFFSEDSVLRVSEKCRRVLQRSWKASTLKEIKNLLLQTCNEWKIALTDCTPNLKGDFDIELKIRGTMYTKGFESEKVFKQTMLLSKCNEGYYISETDLVLRNPPPAMVEIPKKEDIGNKNKPADVKDGIYCGRYNLE
eukprot:g979.t1